MRSAITSEMSQKIKNMSLLCSFLVVSIHVQWTNNQLMSLGWLVDKVIARGFAGIAVPFFFVVSGFFLAQHFDEDGWWWREVNKRLKSLGVPFLIWSMVAFISSLFLSIIADLIANRPFGASIYVLRSDNWLRVLGFDMTDYPFHIPLWYVRCLLLFVLTGYVFRFGLASLRHAWLVGAFLFLLVYSHIPNENVREFFKMGCSADGIFYFSVGIAIQRFGLKMLSMRIALLCGIVGFSLLAVEIVFASNAWCWGGVLSKISLPFLLYFTWHVMTVWKLPVWLTSCSFPIYLMHMLLMVHMAVLLKRLPIGGLTHDFLMFFGSIVASIAITLLLRGVAPKVAATLFGCR